MEIENKLWCFSDKDDVCLTATIYKDEDNIESPHHLWMGIIGNEIMIINTDSRNVEELKKMDIKFGISIEKAYKLRDFLNYALPKKA
ncbi:hypothetical protein [Caudoviricetes sp.]|nr:hypothetical protein [Caudoviricetes sp.]